MHENILYSVQILLHYTKIYVFDKKIVRILKIFAKKRFLTKILKNPGEIRTFLPNPVFRSGLLEISN